MKITLSFSTEEMATLSFISSALQEMEHIYADKGSGVVNDMVIRDLGKAYDLITDLINSTSDGKIDFISERSQA